MAENTHRLNKAPLPCHAYEVDQSRSGHGPMPYFMVWPGFQGVADPKCTVNAWHHSDMRRPDRTELCAVAVHCFTPPCYTHMHWCIAWIQVAMPQKCLALVYSCWPGLGPVLRPGVCPCLLSQSLQFVLGSGRGCQHLNQPCVAGKV